MARGKSSDNGAPKSSQSRASIAVYVLAGIISLVGLADATYLTVQALTGETLVCGGSPDCFKVLGSSYARIAGIPTASFGAIAYFSAFTFATFAAFGYIRARTLFSLTVSLMFVATLWLLFVQAFLLHAFCRFCLLSAAVTFLLTGLVVARSRPS
jgi:uncharacterized membrane protein